MVLEKIKHQHAHTVDHIDHTTYKNYHVWIAELNVKSEAINLLEENSRKS